MINSAGSEASSKPRLGLLGRFCLLALSQDMLNALMLPNQCGTAFDQETLFNVKLPEKVSGPCFCLGCGLPCDFIWPDFLEGGILSVLSLLPMVKVGLDAGLGV